MGHARKRKPKRKTSYLRRLAGEPTPALADYVWLSERIEEPKSKASWPNLKYLELIPKHTEEEL